MGPDAAAYAGADNRWVRRLAQPVPVTALDADHAEAVGTNFRAVRAHARHTQKDSSGVELHGGRIWVKSEIGVGSRSPSRFDKVVVMAGELILVVEDNEKNRRLVRDVLTFEGYQVIETEHGEEVSG